MKMSERKFSTYPLDFVFDNVEEEEAEIKRFEDEFGVKMTKVPIGSNGYPRLVIRGTLENLREALEDYGAGDLATMGDDKFFSLIDCTI